MVAPVYNIRIVAKCFPESFTSKQVVQVTNAAEVLVKALPYDFKIKLEGATEMGDLCLEDIS